MRLSCLVGGIIHGCNVRDKDHKITKVHHFVAQYKYSNVTTNIQMLQYSKVCSNIEYWFMPCHIKLRK